MGGTVPKLCPPKKLKSHPYGQSAGAKYTRIVFWNVQGLATKVELLHDYLSQFQIILLVETFIEEKYQGKIECKLPKGYDWHWTPAVREKAKGRPWGGELIGVAQNLKIANRWQDQHNCCNGVDVEIDGCSYILTNVYCRNGVSNIRKAIFERLEDNKGKRQIVAGDWNARLGKLGGRTANEFNTVTERPTQDTTCNVEGEHLLELMEDSGLCVLNGNKAGDWDGNITHIGYRSQAVLDYVAANEEAWENVQEFTIGDQVLSDHFPLELTLRSTATDVKPQEKTIHLFNPLHAEEYRRRLVVANNSAESWTELVAGMHGSFVSKTFTISGRRNNCWWNSDCYEARRRTRDELRNARRSGVYTDYWAARKFYKSTISQRKQQHQEEFLEKLKRIDNIADGYKFIKNLNNGGAPIGQERPSDEDMRKHFTKLLNGYAASSDPTEIKQMRAALQGEEISVQEFEGHVQRMKTKKAAGSDGIEAEAIIHADQATKSKIRGIMSQCLLGMELPREWREARIFALHKKGDPSVAKNYRGISITNSAYKLYASILHSRLERFVEEQNLLPDGQNGFRKGRSTIDNIYILNHCVRRTLQDGKHLYTCFVDFKAAFDTVNRKKLFSRMRRITIPEYLVAAVEEIYRVTEYSIGGSSFRTDMGLRQGCPLSPLLFAIYISDAEKVLRNWQSGGVLIGGERIFSLAYADDLVLMATTAGEMKDMVECLARYAEKRDLVISTEKTKVIRFSKNGVKSTHKWYCAGVAIEEVKNFCYLGFVFQSNGSWSAHIKMLATKGKECLSRVWSVGERLFADNFVIRRQMYHSLIEPCIVYGCELFGWEERVELEKIQRKYFRWVLGVAPWTKSSLLMAEINGTPVVGRTLKRATQYEYRARFSPCKILQQCIQEQQRDNKSRERALNRLGFTSHFLEEAAVSVVNVASAVMERSTEQFRQCQWYELRNQNIIRPGHLAAYLGRGCSLKLVARFRLQNEERARQQWRRDSNCRVCGEEPETLERILKCSGSGSSVKEILDERGTGAAEMQRIKNWQEQQICINLKNVT